MLPATTNYLQTFDLTDAKSLQPASATKFFDSFLAK